jgi:hypothetical protein
MSLPIPARNNPLKNKGDTPQSAPAVLQNRETTAHIKPTPMMLPKHLRERFEYTPGLYAFMSRILDLSVISQQSPEDIANDFFDHYDGIVKRGEKYPALRAFNEIIVSS